MALKIAQLVIFIRALKSHVSELTSDSKRLREEASAAWAKVVEKESKILNLEQSLSQARHMLGEQDRKSGDVIIQSLQRDQQNVSGRVTQAKNPSLCLTGV
jgi:predicted Holliday junction resolvase-like endonuclease